MRAGRIPVKRRFLAALALGLALAPGALSGQDLPRRATLGVAMAAPAAAGPANPVVDRVLPGQTAERLGVRQGDVIVAAGGRPMASNADAVAYAGTLTAGSPVEIRIRRAGRELRLRGKAIGRPLEAHANARVDYGVVPFRGGGLRDILLTPSGVDDPPVLFLLQGYSCASIESPDPADSYRRLGEEMLARRIAYYRVEKPGMGDSAGGPACVEIDFATELDAFRAAYTHLIEARGVDPDRIFLFGHSLGGMEAPLLAAERPPRGVSAFGTVLRNWADYHHDVDAFQSFLFAGADIGENFAESERNRDLFRRFYFGREAPAQLAGSSPDFDRGLRGAFGWDGGARTFGRSYMFNQDLAHLPLAAAWRDTRSNVLALYGESDMVALHDEDHRLIADIAEYYRPGTGRFVQVPGTGHGMDLIGNRAEVRERTRAQGSVPTGAFNPAVADALAAWIGDSMAQPAVRTRTFPSRDGNAAPAGG